MFFLQRLKAKLYGLRLMERPVFKYRSEGRQSWLRCFATFLSFFQNMSSQCLKLRHDGFLSIFFSPVIVSFEAFTAVWFSTSFFWGTTLRHEVIGSHRFEGTRCLHLSVFRGLLRFRRHHVSSEPRTEHHNPEEKDPDSTTTSWDTDSVVRWTILCNKFWFCLPVALKPSVLHWFQWLR